MERREFLRNAALTTAGLALSNVGYSDVKKSYPLSFSTLGCPKWNLTEILNFAHANGYEGIEIRGILGELDLTKCPDFSSAEKINTVKSLVRDKKVKIVNLGASAALHHADTEKREKSLEEARKFIDLAAKLDCPYVRVFPNNLPKEQDRRATLDLITKGLITLGEHAKGSNVTVLMETHGDVVETNDVLSIMKNSAGPKVGLIWDVVNMWSVTKESPTQVYEKLKPFIRHTHLKDLTIVNGDHHYVLMGQGVAPVAEAVKLLVAGGYKGYYSFEWEKMWHPEIEEPEIAIAQFPKQMERYFKS